LLIVEGKRMNPPFGHFNPIAGVEMKKAGQVSLSGF
jgi:hypothetical protein